MRELVENGGSQVTRMERGDRLLGPRPPPEETYGTVEEKKRKVEEENHSDAF